MEETFCYLYCLLQSLLFGFKAFNEKLLLICFIDFVDKKDAALQLNLKLEMHHKVVHFDQMKIS